MALASARPAARRLSLEHLRARATELYVAVVWLHVPIVAGIALVTNHAWITPTATLATIAFGASVCARYMRDGVTLRSIMALALVAGPIAFGWSSFGNWSLDTSLYFYAVIAMLVGYVDWRPIIIAASAAAFSAVLLSLAASDIVFPAEGMDRFVIQAVCLIAECFVLINLIGILQHLFSNVEALAAEMHEKAHLHAELNKLRASA